MKKAILAGISLKNNTGEFEEQMRETASLCHAAGLEVIDTITQLSRSLDPDTAFRSGKLQELAVLCKETDPDLIVFHNGLRIQMQQRIHEACGVNVIDRTSLILDIFASRARSKQAKLQVELARLQYDLPRVLHSQADESGHERGGSAYNRGAGEMRSALVERRYASRIAALKKELASIDRQIMADERRRTKTMMRRAALVGYTNAGKSSLLNALMDRSESSGKSVMEEDMLFATLDTSVRRIRRNGRSMLIYDTVGFVSDLPHTLIDAFHSTLNSARQADLLIHVIDVSDESWPLKAEITEQTLAEIGAGDIPVLRVYNKTDLCRERPDVSGCAVSCRTKEGIDDLLQEITRRLYPAEETVLCRIPYDKISMTDAYRSVLAVEMLQADEESMIIRITGPKRYCDAFRMYRLENDHYDTDSMGQTEQEGTEEADGLQ